jgi:outer membrane immunogenic protein
MNKGLIAGIAAAALCGASALAADMPVKAPTSAAAFDWSGFYIGGDAGWQGSRIGLSDPTDPTATLTYNPHHNSFALGVFGGAQRQFGQLVLGVEGGYLAGFDRANFSSTSVSIFVPGGTAQATAKMRDIWSIGGRVGWAMGHWMPYVTGGYANGSFELNAHDVPPLLITTSEQIKAQEGGSYIGGGIDWALMSNWIFGVEYRHYGFRAKTVLSTDSLGVPANARFDPRTDTVVARLSYKFDWGK